MLLSLVIIKYIFLIYIRKITLISAPVLSNIDLELSSVVILTIEYRVKKLLFIALNYITLAMFTRISTLVSLFTVLIEPYLSIFYSYIENSSLRASLNLVRRLLIVISTFKSIIDLTNKRASIIFS
jgi:hypothetical protein